MNKKKRNYYKVEHWVEKHGFTIEEAERRIIQLKEATKITLENLIKKYGEVEGTVRYNNFVEKSKHTKEKFIEKYGEVDGSIKWAEYCTKKDSNSEKFFKDKYKENWEEKMSERRKSTLIDLDRYKNKYGDELGIMKYNELLEKRKFKTFVGASKESIVFFKPVIEYLDKLQMKYYFGAGDNKEYRIWSYQIEKRLYYDLVIPDIKLAIEYHGAAFHPNPKTFSEDKKKTWFCPLRKISYDTAVSWDVLKKKILKDERNFDMIEIYSDEIRHFDYNSIYKEIERRLNENKQD